MEFYSIVKVAKEFEIPVKGIFVITNYCDKDAHKLYLENIKDAKKVLINYLDEQGYMK